MYSVNERLTLLTLNTCIGAPALIAKVPDVSERLPPSARFDPTRGSWRCNALVFPERRALQPVPRSAR